MKQFQEKAENVGQKVKEKVNKTKESLDKKQEGLQQKLQAFTSIGADIGEKVKTGMETTLKKVGDSYYQASSEMKHTKRHLHLSHVESTLKDFDEKFKTLRTRINRAETNDRIPLVKALTRFHEKQKRAKSTFEELKAARAESWNGLKSKMDAAMDDLVAAYKQIIAFLPENQEEQEEQMESVLTEFDQKIAQLQEKIDNIEGEKKTRLNESLQVLRKKHIAIRDTHKEFRAERARLWQEYKAKVDMMLEDMERFHEELKEELR